MTGTVVQSVSLAGPHGTMKVRVNNEVWDVTLAPPARTSPPSGPNTPFTRAAWTAATRWGRGICRTAARCAPAACAASACWDPPT